MSLFLLLIQACLFVNSAAVNSIIISLTATSLTTPYSSRTPLNYGVGLGHKCDGDKSWVAYLKYLGTKKARLFGVGGAANTIQSSISLTVGSSITGVSNKYGYSLSSVLVNNEATFTSAVKELRTFNGHDPSVNWAVPVLWNTIDARLSTNIDGDAINGNILDTITQLRSIGVSPLAVTQVGCGLFTFSTLDPTTPIYWAERWELYKHRYAVSRWTWIRNIKDIEFYNEPDISTNTCTQSNKPVWLEMYTLSSKAIQEAYSDFNADVGANRITCPIDSICPIKPNVIASAFAKRTFESVSNFGNITVFNEHTQWPPFQNKKSLTWYNLQAYSYHTYGKDGVQMGTESSALIAQVNAVHDALFAPALPMHITEHASHTSTDWKLLPSSTDDPLEASRLAMQIMIQAKYGFESYIFKFSITPSQSGGVVKSGLLFADNTKFPFRIGDTTLSGEAARLIVDKVQGSKPLKECTLTFTLGSSATALSSIYRNCLSIQDTTMYHLLVVNDASDAASPATVDLSYNFETFIMNLAPLGIALGSVAIMSQVSRSPATHYVYHGEVSEVVSLASSLALSLLHPVPAGGILSISIPFKAQKTSTLSPHDDTYVSAGINVGRTITSTENTFKVGTSITNNHQSTNVGILQFTIPQARAIVANKILLEIYVSNVDSTTLDSYSTSTVLGYKQSSVWATGSVAWTTLTSTTPAALLNTPTTILLEKVSDDFVKFDNPALDIISHVTVNPTDLNIVKQIDVTKFVQAAIANGDANVAIIIARRVRRNSFLLVGTTNAAADDLNSGISVAFYSSEYSDATKRPVLRFYDDVGTPSAALSTAPTGAPTVAPSTPPTSTPSARPTTMPTGAPSMSPTTLPSCLPSCTPSVEPSSVPSTEPTLLTPTFSPTPTAGPSAKPSAALSTAPTRRPLATPSARPTTTAPTRRSSTTAPTGQPTTAPTRRPSTTAPTRRSSTTAPTRRPSTTATTRRPSTTAPTRRPSTTAPTKSKK
jgi:hypothetical protein